MINKHHFYWAFEIPYKDCTLSRLFIVYGYQEHGYIYGITVCGNFDGYIDDNDYTAYPDKYLVKNNCWTTYEEAAHSCLLSPVGCPDYCCDLPDQRVSPTCDCLRKY